MRAPTTEHEVKPNPWAVRNIQQPTASFELRSPSHQLDERHHRLNGVHGAPPTPPVEEETDGMDQDVMEAECEMEMDEDEDEDEESVEQVTGLEPDWQRGRRKEYSWIPLGMKSS